MKSDKAIASKANASQFIEQRLREKSERIKKSHSAFWMGQDAEDLARRVEVGSLEYIERLRKVQRGIGNFVKIVTGKEIPVVYSSGQQSYTDGKSVVLSADLDPEKLDAMAGTALHEGTHCLLSNESLAFLPVMHKQFDQMIAGTSLAQNAKRLGIGVSDPKQSTAMGANGETVMAHVQMVMNVLEDRRIDIWQYQNAPGYRPYYEAMYKEYWHSSKIDAAMKDPKFRNKAVDNYIMHVINMTNSNWDPNALPGLSDIRKIANLSEKGLAARGDTDPGWKSWRNAMMTGPSGTPDLNKFPKLFADAVRIVEIMYQNSTEVQNSQQQQQGQGEGEGDSDLPNMDMQGSEPSDEDGDQEKDGKGKSPSQKEVNQAVRRQRKFLEHDTEKKQLDQESKVQLDQIEQTKATIVDVEGEFLPKNVKARVIVYRDITKQVVQSPAFPFKYNSYNDYYGRNRNTSRNGTNEYMDNALRDGIRMGQVLAHRLRIMADEKPLTFNRQKHGRIDKRRLASLGMGSQDTFAFTIIEKKKPANIWLDVDFSGSMSGDKSQKAMTVAVAIAYAAEKTRTLNVTIAIRDGGSDAARVAILYDSRRHQFRRLREILPYITVGGGTPESLCFEAVREEMMKVYKDERKFFVNLSDGEPGHSFSYKGRHYSYGGEHAYKHCRTMMNDFRQAGINVLSYYIGHEDYEHEGFKRMYGMDARFISPDNVNQIAITLNKLLLS